MANATISQIKVGNNTYDICDVTARDFTSIGEKIYPIGSIYLSLNDTNPSILFGFGTWEALTEGYALWTSTTASNYGNTANAGNTGSTTLNANQSGLPAHTHSFTNPKIPNHVHTMTHHHNYEYAGDEGASASGDNPSTYGNFWRKRKPSEPTGATTADYTGNSGNPTSLPATTGGAVGAVTDGAKAAASGHTHTAGVPARIYVHAWKRTA